MKKIFKFFILILLLYSKTLFSTDKILYLLSISENQTNKYLLDCLKNKIKLFLLSDYKYRIIEETEISSLSEKALNVINKFKNKHDIEILKKISNALKVEKLVLFQFKNNPNRIEVGMLQSGNENFLNIITLTNYSPETFAEIEEEISKKILNTDYEIIKSKFKKDIIPHPKEIKNDKLYSLIIDGYKKFLDYKFEESLNSYNEALKISKEKSQNEYIEQLKNLATKVGFNYIENRIWLYYKKAENFIQDKKESEAKEILENMKDIFKSSKFLSYETFNFYNRLALFLNKKEIEIGKFYGTSDNDVLLLLEKIEGNKIIIVGKSAKNDILFIKVIVNNNEIFKKELRFEETIINNVKLIKTNEFLICGARWIPKKERDLYIARLNSKFEILWERTIGGKYFDCANKSVFTSDNNIILVGNTASFGRGSLDIYIVKFDENGNFIWQKTFGGKEFDAGLDIIEIENKNLLIYGITKSFGETGAEDLMFLKIDKDGNPIWFNIK